MNWVEGWQGGLILGGAVALVCEVLGRALYFWLRDRKAARCRDCNGFLADDGRAIGAMEKLEVCPTCGDSWPGVPWWTAKDMEARDAAVTCAEAVIEDKVASAQMADEAASLAGYVYWLVITLDRVTPPSPRRAL